MDDKDLRDMSTFQQLYLIGKVLGEAIPIKLIASKCLLDRQVVGEVNIVDMGNGFNLLNSLTKLTVIVFWKDNPGFLVVKSLVFKDGKKILIRLKKDSTLLSFGFSFLVFLWSFGPNLLWKICLSQF